MTLPAGTRIGRYEVAACVGSGGMGEVYRARDTLLDRVVAIKLLPAGEHAGQKALEKEARAVAGLSHPNIGTLHDLGEHEGRLFLVMEFIEGETLSARLRHGALPLDLALRYAREIAEALDAAHRQGIVHRDIKPSNVVLTTKAEAKLVDFGIATFAGARTSGRDRTITRTGEKAATGWSGTVPYMAPERIRGERGDARADVFSLGVVLYEMLSGTRPFDGDNDVTVAAAIVSEEPPPLGHVPQPVQRLVRRCLAKNPDDRWQTARDLAEALSFLPNRSPAPAPRLLRRAWPRTAQAGAVVAVVMAAAIAVAILSRMHASSSPLPVVVLMDSTLPERVYDPDTRAVGGTNSDDITDALRGLPVVLLKEPTSALWHREEQLLGEKPALVMMHLSSFARPNPSHESDLQVEAVERTRSFLALIGIGNPLTRFVVYTRGFATEANRAAWISETEDRFPVLRGRLQMLHVPGGDETATFRDPAVKKRVRDLVASTLQIAPG